MMIADTSAMTPNGIKKFTDEMLTWLRGKGKILIVIHDHPDPDCLASAMALSHLFVSTVNREAFIAFSGMIGRSENIAMAKELEITLTPLGMIDLNEFNVICMLDTQPGTGNNSLPPGTKVDIVVDHHPIRENSRHIKWVDVREDYGVTATILYEYLLAQGVHIGTKLATALFYAIKSETQDLGREANKPDREAYLRLFPLSNKKLLYEISHPKLPKEHFFAIHSAIANSKVFGDVLVVNLMEISYPEVVAEIADFLIRLEGIRIVLTLGVYNNEIVISMRTTSHDLNAGEITKRLVNGMGTAGGHSMMAGGKLDNISVGTNSVEEIEGLLTEKLLDLLEMKSVSPKMLTSL